MVAKKTLPYGAWPSPITPALVARGSRRFGTVQSEGGTIYWTESRPEEGGRQVIMRAKDSAAPKPILPKPYSARSRVHEYGGGEFLAADGTVYFVNDRDQQIYALDANGGARPRRITRAPGTRFADFVHDAARRRLIAVAESHDTAARGAGHALPRNGLVAVPLGSGRAATVTALASGHDFYASPRLSPDGTRLAFLAWNLPDMPWDSATLFVAEVAEDGKLGRATRLAGGDNSAAFQPEWAADGTLTFVWDKAGWGALYQWREGKISLVHAVAGADLSRPQWVFGMRAYALRPQGDIGMVFLAGGTPRVEVRSRDGKIATLARPMRAAARIDDICADEHAFAALVSRPLAAPAVMRVDRGGLADIGAPEPLPVDKGFLSRAVPQTYRTARGQTAHGFYYPPANAKCRTPKRALPPAIVFVHGGPTSMTDSGLKLRIQFYTSRGFAAFDVNYSGSTGYGRAYRNRLDGQWGIADVADCAAAARYLASAGLADKRRIAITGGSAGGYTTLMALATTDAFAAGSSHYGVSDLSLLMEHTHKFESGYLHRLLGTSPRNWRKTCAARSPINLIDGITAPVILFQGLDDKVVPPEQSRLIAGTLKRRGIDVALHEFPGEAHGFRRAETIVAVLEAELAFFRRALQLG
ncbi:MAG TPA: prolyl oligopeptidase family serine peptidase [Hyphomicrobiaceae bacterium]|nr:prolyl oligopeptidase family serine peptidase [Hyphomicrobiaceae bacterium]